MALAVSDIVANAVTSAVFGTNTTKTFTLPTVGVSEGDIMYLVAGINIGGGDVADVLTTPAGWSLVGSSFAVPDTASTPRFYIFARAVPGGGLGSTVDITSSSSTNMSHGGVAFAVQGAELIPDVVGTPTAGTDTTINCPAVTASETGGLIIRVGGNDDDDQSSQPSMTSHSAVNFVQVGNTVQNGWNAYVWSALQPSTSVAASSASISNEQNAGQTFVIQEAASGVEILATSDALVLANIDPQVHQAPRVYLNTTETKSGANEMTVTSYNLAGTSITFTDPAGGLSGSLKLGVENIRSQTIGWIDVTVNTGAGQTIEAGLSLETDSALAVGIAKGKDAGLTVETDSALTADKLKEKAVGLNAENDSAFGAGKLKEKSVGLATETDSAFAVTVFGSKIIEVGLAVETTTAFAVDTAKLLTPGLVVETDLSLAVTKLKVKNVGLGLESDLSLVATAIRAVSVGLATESDVSLPTSHARTKEVGLAVEIDTAFLVVGQQTANDAPYQRTKLVSITYMIG